MRRITYIIIRNIGWELDEKRIDRNEKENGKSYFSCAPLNGLVYKIVSKYMCTRLRTKYKCYMYGQLKILNDPEQVVILFHHFDTNKFTLLSQFDCNVIDFFSLSISVIVSRFIFIFFPFFFREENLRFLIFIPFYF